MASYVLHHIAGNILLDKYKLSDEKKALLSSLARINGTMSMGKGGVVLEIRSENAKIAKLLFVIIKDLYNIESRILVAKKMKLKKNNVYLVQIKDNGLAILEDLEIYRNNKFDNKLATTDIIATLVPFFDKFNFFIHIFCCLFIFAILNNQKDYNITT